MWADIKCMIQPVIWPNGAISGFLPDCPPRTTHFGPVHAASHGTYPKAPKLGSWGPTQTMMGHGRLQVYTLLSTWPGHHPSPWPTHPHQAPTNHGQCTGMHSALVGHTCTTINCNFCKLAFTPQGAPPHGQICPCSPCAPPPAGPRGPQAASPKIGIYQQPIFGGGYILGIY